jgi:Transposase zinc-binding domain
MGLLHHKKPKCKEYKRNDLRHTLLFQSILNNFNTFLQQTEHDPLPPYIEKEFREYIQCGILSYGFARLTCEKCNHSFAIPFSCKGRGFCPSCMGRRMNEMAVHLTENVFPKVPIRQFVLSIPKQLRYILAYNPKLTTKVLNIFLFFIVFQAVNTLLFLLTQWVPQGISAFVAPASHCPD